MGDNIDELCKGCATYEKKREPFHDLYLECPGYTVKDKYCPCKSCLVKGMCLSPCDVFNKRSMVWEGSMKNAK